MVRHEANATFECLCARKANQSFREKPHVQALRDELRQRSKRAWHVSDFQKHAAGLLRLHGETRVGSCRIGSVRGNGEATEGIADCTAEFRIVARYVPRFNSLEDE
jgi:hypothetical protein